MLKGVPCILGVCGMLQDNASVVMACLWWLIWNWLALVHSMCLSVIP